MNAIRNKLRGNDGASIFMGLMFLLVCLMVGAVVLAAATAAAGKLAELRETEQNYLNVASAAQMMKKEICKLTYTREWKEDPDVVIVKEGFVNPENPTQILVTNDVVLGGELLELCRTLTSANPAPLASTDNVEFDISLEPGSVTLDEEWKKVNGSLSMEVDGRIIVELWLGDKNKSESDAKINNLMKIEFCPDGPVTKTVVENKEKYDVDGNPYIEENVKYVTMCSWPEGGCTITKGTK